MPQKSCWLCWLVALAIFFWLRPSPALAQSSVSGKVGAELVSDFKYLANNVTDDAIDVLTSPLHFSSSAEAPTSSRFYLVLAGAGALWGGSFALDQTMRSHLRGMSAKDADLLQNVSYGSVGTFAAFLYGYGLYEGDTWARQVALTAGEGAGIATLLDIGIKAAFGRSRPYQSHGSHTAFFHGGQSFVSGDVAPMFALAAGVSEYYENRWYVALPVYSLAFLDGFGRMGHDAHWFSDVIGAAVLGVGVTKLLLWLHKRHELNPGSFKIFPVSPPPTGPRQRGGRNGFGVGVGIEFSW